MVEQLIKFFEEKENDMRKLDFDRNIRKIFFDQCFGALEFVNRVTHGEHEAELAELWQNNWYDKLLTIVYGLD